MKKFLAVYIGTPDSPRSKEWESLDDATRAAREEKGMALWHAWMEKNKASIVDAGAPLGETKKISPKGVSDVHNALCGYTVIQAESFEAAARLYLEHPHFTIFPGESVELMECLDIPGM